MKTNFTQQLIQHYLEILLGNVQWQAVRALFFWCGPHYGLLILNTKQNVFYNNSDMHPLYPVDSSLLDFKLLSYLLCKVGETSNFLEKDLTETSGQASLRLGHLWRWCEMKTRGVTYTCECLGESPISVNVLGWPRWRNYWGACSHTGPRRNHILGVYFLLRPGSSGLTPHPNT